MNQPSPWFKILALCTTLGLGGSYVWNRQQEAEQSKRALAARDAREKQRASERDELMLMASTKSQIGIVPPDQLPYFKKGTRPAEHENRTLMPGSKRGGIELVEAKQLGLQFQAPTEKDKEIIKETQPLEDNRDGITQPGSHIVIPVDDPPAPAPAPAAPPRILMSGSKSLGQPVFTKRAYPTQYAEPVPPATPTPVNEPNQKAQDQKPRTMLSGSKSTILLPENPVLPATPPPAPPRAMMSGSKSMVLPEFTQRDRPLTPGDIKVFPVPPATPIPIETNQAQKAPDQKKRAIMSGSKSAPVFQRQTLPVPPTPQPDKPKNNQRRTTP